jgi:hypothetical protein
MNSNTMTPPSETPARPFSARLLDVLRLFDRCRGAVVIEARSMSGIAHEIVRLDPPMPGFIPAPLADALLDNLSLRLSVASRAIDGTPRDLPFVFAVWKLASDFNTETDYRHVVRPAEQARVREALDGFPLPPAFLLDAGPEVAALWPLTAPLSADDPGADALLTALAARLGADVVDVTALVPLAGPVRNWNTSTPAATEICDIRPVARYTPDSIETALTAMPTTTTSAPPTAERRKGARS